VDPAVPRREGQVLLGVLHGDRLLEAILQRDLHPDRDGPHVVVDVSEVRRGGRAHAGGPGKGPRDV